MLRHCSPEMRCLPHVSLRQMEMKYTAHHEYARSPCIAAWEHTAAGKGGGGCGAGRCELLAAGVRCGA